MSKGSGIKFEKQKEVEKGRTCFDFRIRFAAFLALACKQRKMHFTMSKYINLIRNEQLEERLYGAELCNGTVNEYERISIQNKRNRKKRHANHRNKFPHSPLNFSFNYYCGISRCIYTLGDTTHKSNANYSGEHHLR